MARDYSTTGRLDHMTLILTLPLGMTATNCYLVADEASKDAVVIDPGDEAGKVLNAIQRNALNVKAVLLTHTHFDHIGAVGEVVAATRAPLAVHPKELPLYRAGGGAALFGLPLRRYPEPDVLIAPGRPLSYGALTFEVLFVPGHTAGHVAFFHAPSRAVFSGDVLFQDGIGRTDFPGSSYETLMHSIKHVLFALPDETTVYSGHGPATTIGAEKRNNPFLAE
jgi:glyoxylase-like metal-dependent hydrolase (beta-lactamase superfamily II)